MTESTGKQIYKIYRRIMQDAPYRQLAGEYREKLDSLQALSATFSEDQWKAIHEYIDIAFKIHQTMMEIALQTSTLEQK